MAITNVLLTSTQVTQIFQAAANNEFAITTMFFCNNSTATNAVLDIYVVQNGTGGPDSRKNKVINQLSLPAKETFVFDAEKLILFNTDAIWARADAVDIVAATISSVKTS
jgi:hypothetical protein